MTELPTPDLPLLRKAVDWAGEQANLPPHQREWDQMVWRDVSSCDTAYCIAGYTTDVLLDMQPFLFSMVINEHGQRESVATAAQLALGLTDDEANALFNQDNDITTVRAVADAICQRAGERL